MSSFTRAARRSHRLSLLLAAALPITGCAGVRAQTPPAVGAAPTLVPAKRGVPPPSVAIVAVPTPLPLPGQLQPFPAKTVPAKTERTEPGLRVERANAAARIEPQGGDWLNAIQLYPYADGALYQVYAAPGKVTDIALQAGEELVGPGPVAAGDTVRWIIGDTVSGTGETKLTHILVKPTRSDIATNLVINTDRRTYHLELKATQATWMAAVSWTYPEDELIALRAANAKTEQMAAVASGIDPAALNFRYRIEGDKPSWRPVRAFDDGRQAYIEFPEGVATGDMPPLFVSGPDGSAELVNYRVQGRYMIVDRLFATAELRLGKKKSQARVRIEREDGPAKRRQS